MGKLEAVTAAQLAALVRDAKTPVVIDFYSTGCGPCKAMAPVLENIAASYNGSMAFVKVDVDNDLGVQQAYRVGTLPTLLLYDHGREVGRLKGYQGEAAIRRTIDGVLGKK